MIIAAFAPHFIVCLFYDIHIRHPQNMPLTPRLHRIAIGTSPLGVPSRLRRNLKRMAHVLQVLHGKASILATVRSATSVRTAELLGQRALRAFKARYGRRAESRDARDVAKEGTHGRERASYDAEEGFGFRPEGDVDEAKEEVVGFLEVDYVFHADDSCNGRTVLCRQYIVRCGG